MGLPNKQIGWSNESNLLWEVLRQVTELGKNLPSGEGGIQSIVAGANITIDATDPLNPIIIGTGGGPGDIQSVLNAGGYATNDAGNVEINFSLSEGSPGVSFYAANNSGVYSTIGGSPGNAILQHGNLGNTEQSVIAVAITGAIVRAGNFTGAPSTYNSILKINPVNGDFTVGSNRYDPDASGFLYISPESRSGALGDSSNIFNGTKMVIEDAIKYITFNSKNSESFVEYNMSLTEPMLRMYASEDGDSGARITLTKTACVMDQYDASSGIQGRFSAGSGNSFITMTGPAGTSRIGFNGSSSEDYVDVTSDNPSFEGIRGSENFSANYGENTYVQAIYISRDYINFSGVEFETLSQESVYTYDDATPYSINLIKPSSARGKCIIVTNMNLIADITITSSDPGDEYIYEGGVSSDSKILLAGQSVTLRCNGIKYIVL